MKKQIISEIVDQGLDPGEIEPQLSRLASDMENCKSWQNYHLIGDVIRGEVKSGRCLMNKMKDALDAEPTVLVPRASNTPDSSKRPGFGSDAVKSAGLFAIAASIALVAVLTLSPSASPPTGNNAIASSAAESLPVPVEQSAADRQMFRNEFGQMLVEHGEFTATSGLNGLVAYAKLVTNEKLND